MNTGRVALLAVAAVSATLAVGGCGGGDPAQAYRDKLTRAGFTSVTVEADEESTGTRKKRKKRVVAYDFDWVVNTDNDPQTCTVELEHPGDSGELRGNHWHIDEVNGQDVNGWGAGSPNPDTVRRLLREHQYDC
ncbi:hypothetical protein [Plantactinospora sp. B5E13]|uniref:hypothetical protein n=1 Tax=unclassified Plantactinospora TaxID=2631981 RepID=UPI00325F8FD5